MNSDFSLIKEKLEELSQVDKDRSIFGAPQHNYISYPVAISEIESFEQKYGFQLPEQYRFFLLEIGYGAGPYYGIWSLRETDLELSSMIAEFKEEENVIVNPANVFPFNSDDIELLKISFDKNIPREDKRNTYPIDGNITILHQGCQGYGTLVTKGEFAGTVWDLYWDGGYDGYWNPARPAVCLQTSNGKIQSDNYRYKHFPTLNFEKNVLEPISFLDWFEEWLDNSLRAFSELREYNYLRICNRLKPI
jgi:hypothetical protein